MYIKLLILSSDSLDLRIAISNSFFEISFLKEFNSFAFSSFKLLYSLSFCSLKLSKSLAIVRSTSYNNKK